MRFQSGARSIHIAARRGHVAVIQALLQKGEQVDATTNVRITFSLDSQANSIKQRFLTGPLNRYLPLHGYHLICLILLTTGY